MPINSDSKFAIVGAGIGGLCLAIALAEKGYTNLKIFERRSSLSDMGAGLQLGPNAVRCLSRLGLDQALAQIADRAEFGEMYDAKDHVKLAVLPLDRQSMRAYQLPTYQLHRADLYELLSDRVNTMLGQSAVKFGRAVASLNSDTGSVTFEDGAEVHADIVVGADGIDSSVRNALFNSSVATYSGSFAWRGLVNAKKLATADKSPNLRAWVSEGKHLLAYPIRGGELINLVGVSESADWPHSSPVIECQASEWLQDYADWGRGCPTGTDAVGIDQLPLRLIRQLDLCQKWALRLIPSETKWGQGKVLLLGDAAHPMLPSLAQGAGQSIEDALVLADIIASGTYSVEEILRQYQSMRDARVRRVQRASHWNLRFFHQKKTPLRYLRNAAMRAGGQLTTHIIARKYRWLYRA